MNIIDGRWVYSWKGDSDGFVLGPKARLCARGFKQRHGIDFFETFSPCPNVSSIRLLAAIACSLGLSLFHSMFPKLLCSLSWMNSFTCACPVSAVPFRGR